MSAKSPARSAISGGPPSSPRLPSPPPLPELQLGPRSPSINATGGELSLEDAAAQDEGAARRIRPGTSAADMAKGPPFVPLHQVDSPFQLQEYLKSSYCMVTRDENSNTIKPITKETATQLAKPPIQQETGEPVERNLWLYELCRFLVQRTNRLIVSFFADSPPCSSQTCPEMRASEWQYLCAVHEPPKSCCAIDYCCHTLDWAANVLTSPKHFPSRLALGGEGVSAYQSMRQLTNIFRRVYRIYAHAWFQHREAFWSLEQEEGLYKFFRTVCDEFALIPEDNYTIPSEAEAEREESAETPIIHRISDLHILTNNKHSGFGQSQSQPTPEPQATPTEAEPEPVPIAGPTVRRHGHRHTPSTGTQVTMIAEGPEEEDENASNTTGSIPQVVAESTSTSNTQLSNSPPTPAADPPPRSPRPSMSIPINDPKEDIRIPEDPTPTPERHASDPFSDPANVQATQEALAHANAEQQPDYPDSSQLNEPAAHSGLAALSASIPIYKPEELPTSKTPIPPLNTKTPPRVVNEDEEIRSPGGGSIRTIGGDILSGILAHVHSDNTGASKNQEKGQDALPTPDEASVAKEADSAVQDQSGKDSASTSNATKEETETTEEALEEMGEIKLVETAINTNDPEEGDNPKEAEPENKSDSQEEKEKEPTKEKESDVSTEKRDDGTKPEETPSGVV